MNKKIVPALLIGLVVPGVYAEGVDSSFHAGTELYSDSDDMTVDRWSLGYRHGHDIFNYKHDNEPEDELLWSINVTQNNIDQDVDDDFEGYSLKGTVGKKFNEQFSAELGLGNTSLENQRTGLDKDLTYYHLKGKADLNEQVTLHASQKRDFMFDHAIVHSDDGKVVHGDSSNMSVYWRPQEKWRVNGSLTNNDLSDGNESQQVGGSLLYGISPGWPWIWAGVKAEKLEYDQDRSSYWTPEDYTSYGLTVDSSFAVNEQLSMNLGANLNRNKEDNNPSGTGYSVSAGADWKLSDNIDLKAKGYLLESTQESSDWKQDSVNISVNMKSF